MTADTKYQDAQIRRDLGLKDDVPINHAVRTMVQRMDNDGFWQAIGAQEIPKEDRAAFSKLFAQGMQWVYQNYPQARGADDILIGPEGQSAHVASLGKAFPFMKQIYHYSEKDSSFIVIPTSRIQQVSNAMQHERKGNKAEVKVNDEEGPLTLAEYVFLVGVEEAYHVVQYQDKALHRALTPPETLENLNDTYQVSPVHDGKSTHKEIDAGKIRLKALAEFRQRQAQRDRP